MCIRDSNRAKRGVFVEEDVERVSLLALVIALIAANANLPAVSYTHLRAHETVLDLVCRLLLDKQKSTHRPHHHACTATTHITRELTHTKPTTA